MRLATKAPATPVALARTLGLAELFRGSPPCELGHSQMTSFDGSDREVEEILEAGNVALRRDDFRAAEHAFREALALRPWSAVLTYNLALALQHQGRLVEAIGYYDRALDRDPTDYWGFINRGRAYCDLEDYRQALDDFAAAIAIDPSIPSAHFNRGYALDSLGEHEGALVAYDRSIALRPDDAAAWFNRAMACAALQRHHEAIAALDRAIALDPMDPDSYELRASEYSDIGNVE